MKLRLIESAVPISKLEKNIEKYVLPTLEDVGINFLKVTNNPTSYKTIYRGTLGNTSVKLVLYSSYPALDSWNNDTGENRDLFAVLYLGGTMYELGPISSKDPDTITDELEDLNIEDYKTFTQDQLNRQKLIEPLSNAGNYKPMTKEEWKSVYKKLENDVEQARIAMHNQISQDEFNEILNKDIEELPKDHPYKIWKDKSDFFYKVFIPRVYPLEII